MKNAFDILFDYLLKHTIFFKKGFEKHIVTGINKSISNIFSIKNEAEDCLNLVNINSVCDVGRVIYTLVAYMMSLETKIKDLIHFYDKSGVVLQDIPTKVVFLPV